jgi:hypothetical protein
MKSGKTYSPEKEYRVMARLQSLTIICPFLLRLR